MYVCICKFCSNSPTFIYNHNHILKDLRLSFSLFGVDCAIWELAPWFVLFQWTTVGWLCQILEKLDSVSLSASECSLKSRGEICEKPEARLGTILNSGVGARLIVGKKSVTHDRSWQTQQLGCFSLGSHLRKIFVLLVCKTCSDSRVCNLHTRRLKFGASKFCVALNNHRLMRLNSNNQTKTRITAATGPVWNCWLVQITRGRWAYFLLQ